VIPVWNDADGRSKADVLAAFDVALSARGAESVASLAST
jgi:hypothetical protein